jgi:hypothetical protein
MTYIHESFPPISIPEWPIESKPASFQVANVSQRDRGKVMLRFISVQNPPDSVDMYIPGNSLPAVIKYLCEAYRASGNMTLEQTVKALMEG